MSECRIPSLADLCLGRLVRSGKRDTYDRSLPPELLSRYRRFYDQTRHNWACSEYYVEVRVRRVRRSGNSGVPGFRPCVVEMEAVYCVTSPVPGSLFNDPSSKPEVTVASCVPVVPVAWKLGRPVSMPTVPRLLQLDPHTNYKPKPPVN